MNHHEPQALLSSVEREAEAVGAKAMLTSHRHSRLREKWCAAKFGCAYGKSFAPCSIEIEEQDEQREYDFHFHTKGVRLPFQIAEVLTPGRQRGNEYGSQAPAEIAAKYRGAPVLSSSEAIEELRKSLEKKVARRYAGAEDLSVLLYVNLDAASLKWSEAQAALELSASQFASVRLLSENAFTCIRGGSLWPPSGGWHANEEAGS